MSATQYQIEIAAGIDKQIAQHMMAMKTPAAKSAMDLLRLQVAHFDRGGFELLKCAVTDCAKELATLSAASASETGKEG